MQTLKFWSLQFNLNISVLPHYKYEYLLFFICPNNISLEIYYLAQIFPSNNEKPFSAFHKSTLKSFGPPMFCRSFEIQVVRNFKKYCSFSSLAEPHSIFIQLWPEVEKKIAYPEKLCTFFFFCDNECYHFSQCFILGYLNGAAALSSWWHYHTQRCLKLHYNNMYILFNASVLLIGTLPHVKHKINSQEHLKTRLPVESVTCFVNSSRNLCEDQKWLIYSYLVSSPSLPQTQELHLLFPSFCT